MVDISKVKKGTILILSEFQEFWERDRLVYGVVVLIDTEKNMIGIRVGEETRSFPTEKLWTIPAFVANCRSTKQPTPANNREKLLTGLVISIANGEVTEATLKEIAEEFRKQGMKPAAPQELLEIF